MDLDRREAKEKRRMNHESTLKLLVDSNLKERGYRGFTRISSGSFGTVYKALFKQPGSSELEKLVAIKVPNVAGARALN